MDVSDHSKSPGDESSSSPKPSELVMMAINNIGSKMGATESEIVKFIADCLRAEPKNVAGAVRTTLKNHVAVGIVTDKNGRFRLTETVKRSSREATRHRKMVKKRRKGTRPVVLGVYRCRICGKQKRVIMEEEIKMRGPAGAPTAEPIDMGLKRLPKAGNRIESDSF
ncbi:UNVERIFIED_CONTAM: hypothetical protein PYX00_007483 [Menopon gallinae]|uniref:H15 domain-containing protein n=1 Tax=Menopon gallinae TaxID=328185 RepID=A0AAW2HJX3_9NEOP